jgi:hypothetical protein
VVDTDTVKRVLNEQAVQARGNLQRLLTDYEFQAARITGTLAPWLGRAWVMDQSSYQIAGLPHSGSINTDAYEALREACKWIGKLNSK